MSDPRLLSIHLEGQPRRDQFRAARDVLRGACGLGTLAGDARLLGPDDRLDGATLDAPPDHFPHLGGLPLTAYLKDGANVYPLHLGMNSVGRLPDNDVVIRDDCVSRRHCAVVVHSDFRCELHDVASKNGTLLNGAKLSGPTRLQSGDQLLLCTRKLTFVVAESAAKPAAAG